MPNEKTRAYLYSVAVVVVPLLIAYGVVDEQNAALWLALVAAVLGLGMARANTTTKPPED